MRCRPFPTTLPTRFSGSGGIAAPPILRFIDNGQDRPSYLRRFKLVDGKTLCSDYALAKPTSSEALAKVPFYLLLVGSPKVLPWSLQYALNASRRAASTSTRTRDRELRRSPYRRLGRRRLESVVRPAVDRGSEGEASDITEIMRSFIGDRLDAYLAKENYVTHREYIKADDATVGKP